MAVDRKTQRGTRGVRRRKQRIQASTPSSSTSSSSDESETPPSKSTKSDNRGERDVKRASNGQRIISENPAPMSAQQTDTSTKGSDSLSTNEAKDVSGTQESKVAPQQASVSDELDFDAWYLKAVTEQFGSDLEKLRQAPDFREASVPMLIDFLKQGSALFSDEEKRMVMQSSG